MKVSLVATLAFLFAGAGFCACFAQVASTPLQKIAAIARDARLPLGIVLGTDRSLCSASTFPVDIPSDPVSAIRLIGGHYGYVLDGTSPMVLRSPETSSRRLMAALRYRFPIFPAIHDTMPEMSAVLTGWVWISFGHASGWGASIGTTPGAERFSLPASVNATTEEIVGKMVSLSGKGVWIASDTGGNAVSGLRIGAYSYADDLKTVEHLKCD
jgi:hypothetical protein